MLPQKITVLDVVIGAVTYICELNGLFFLGEHVYPRRVVDGWSSDVPGLHAVFLGRRGRRRGLGRWGRLLGGACLGVDV